MRRLRDPGNFAAEAIAGGPPAFISWLSDGHLLTANQAFLRLAGLTAEAAEKMMWPEDFCVPETATSLRRAMTDLDRGSSVQNQDGMLVRRDGSLVLVLLAIGKYCPAKEELYYYSFLTDLSGYKPAVAALDYYEQKTRQYLDMTFSPVWVNQGGKLVYANQRCADLLGANSPGELVGKPVFDIVHPDYHEIVRDRIEIMLEEDRGVPVIDEKLIRQDGEVILARVTALKFIFERQPAILVILCDITESRETEAAIRESREMLRMIIDNVPQRIFWKDTNSVYRGCNKYFAAAAGVGTPGNIVGKTDYDLAWTGEQADAFRRDDREVMDHDRPKYHIIEPQRQADGSLSWLDTNKVPLHDLRGKVIGILGTYEDITDRLRLQEKLKESQAGLLKAQQIARLGSWENNLQTGEEHWSDEFYRILGFRPGSVKPDFSLYLSLIHPDDRERINQSNRVLTEGAGVSRVDYRIIRPDGSVRYVHSEAEATYDETGQPVKLFGTSQDITERKQVEISLEDAKDQAEMYLDLMGHDIANLDQIAMGFLELALETLGPDSPTREYLIKPMEALEASTGLIQRVKKLQQIKESDKALHEVNVGQALSEVLAANSSIPGRAITFHTTINCDCKVKANDLLKDVFENLISNAIKHSTGPLTIWVSAGHTRAEGRVCCQVSIEDNGPGIPDKLKKDIFARFARGSKKASGRGLGLYLVKSLVDLYQGKVWVEDRIPGDYTRGAKFVVLLPLA